MLQTLRKIKAFLSLAILFLSTNGLSTHAQDKGPNWYGELDAGPRLFRFYVVVKDSKATLISLDEGDTEFRLDDYQSSDQKVRFELKSTKASFEGDVEAASGTLRGTWSQGGAKLPMQFRPVSERPKDDASDIWGGTLEAGPQKLALQFRIYADAQGGKRAYFDSLSQKVGGLKAKYREEGKKVFLDCDTINAKFEGEKSDDGKTLSGEFTQGATFKLSMTRQATVMSSKAVESKRPQTPKGPFPYDTEEVSIENQSAKVKLQGTLTFPKNQPPSSVAILISGSGPQDRDETLLDHKPFAVLADYLTRRGIAVLRYDERGVGASTGNYATATSRDFADDVKAVVEFAKKHSKLSGAPIGLIGHSEGGLIAPMVASEMPEVAWIVLMAGTGVTGADILFSQNKLILKAQGASDREIKHQIAGLQVAFQLVQDPNLKPDAMATKWKQLVFEQLSSGDDPLTEEEKAKIETGSEALVKTLSAPWMKYFLAHDPGPVLEKVRCPVLALNGEKDLQVEVDLNFPKMEQALKKGGNKSFELVRLPNLNHLFQNCTTGSPVEYQNIEETLDQGFLQKVGEWIQKQSRPRSN